MWKEINVANIEEIEDECALDLVISGAVGSFAVKSNTDGTSIPVRYIQTQVSFSLDDTHQTRLFENLVPVREIFEPRDLDFDELMQRDIDDGRVSSQLIPYLLENGTNAKVKFFPPIVTAVIPISNDKKLLDYYPDVNDKIIPVIGTNYEQHIIKSGNVGQEVFQFETAVKNKKERYFDNAKLKINTTNCKIVIVDGQHRAMALLALHRNTHGWPDKTNAFKDYYKRWSKNIVQDNLHGISLPIIICVFPSLDGRNKHTVVSACRSVFLDLNKTARPVSTARNILLDDQDIIAKFERSLLSEVKNIDIHSQTSLRLWNFELDADENKVQLSTTVAFSGVMHIFYLLERLLLSPDSPSGLTVPKRNFGAMKNLESCLRRLDGYNLLGTETSKKITRKIFTDESINSLIRSFSERYGYLIIKGFKLFSPFNAMADSALELELKIQNKFDMKCLAMMYEGQGIQRVFESYLEHLNAECGDASKPNTLSPEIKAISKEFEETNNRLSEYKDEFCKLRAGNFIKEVPGRCVSEPLVKEINALYKQMFTTSAFQSALFITFFSVIEKYNQKTRQQEIVFGDQEDKDLFEEYINTLNAWFLVKNDSDFKKIIDTFAGKINGSITKDNLKFSENKFTLRKIVIPGELKPDEWTKFRYIILELWRTSNPSLDSIIKSNRDKCRKDVINNFYMQQLRDHCSEHGADPTSVKSSIKEKIKNESVDRYWNALKNLQTSLSETEKKEIKDCLNISNANLEGDLRGADEIEE